MKRILTNRRCSAALEIFHHGLAAVNPREAIQRSVALKESVIRVFTNPFELTNKKVYVISIGKAAGLMAAGLHEVLGDRITGGLIAGPLVDQQTMSGAGNRWRTFAGGHPLPNAESLAAAAEAFRLLKRANEERALVIFLISGGGSAMIEWPRIEAITLDDLREANRVLVGSGASIAEINTIRRGFSAVKGGGLAAAAPDTNQLTLIVSDTNRGDEVSVASGPSLTPAQDGFSMADVMNAYDLRSRLPQSIVEAVESFEAIEPQHSAGVRAHYVLLDNQTALDAAAKKASEMGYGVGIAGDIVEQPIEEGCRQLMSRLSELLKERGSPVCLLSGGEFSCRVRGNGVGGRNLETVLRCTMDLSSLSNPPWKHFVVLSAGTDGVDGNSAAAGAISDENSMMQAKTQGLDVQNFLKESDSFRFFQLLDSTITTGITGTNVRDLRILLAVP
jgi:glycerate 2-kinase